MCCTADPAQGAVLQVDHVKPRAKFPELALDINNLQILCEICNIGKLHHSESDWR
ncbi:HNH endonuclease [Bowmanella sp. JS7-9]|uniref:HNH endonuclease n=1 Tax=Pseudobowmanella zhangzhouensis TaxID=1537679 RepID=A0ABW1XK56_9ALTE